jgi:hypothetical protein
MTEAELKKELGLWEKKLQGASPLGKKIIERMIRTIKELQNVEEKMKIFRNPKHDQKTV